MQTWGYDEFWNDTVRLYHLLIEQGLTATPRAGPVADRPTRAELRRN
jgi:hypothetical protein